MRIAPKRIGGAAISGLKVCCVVWMLRFVGLIPGEVCDVRLSFSAATPCSPPACCSHWRHCRCWVFGTGSGSGPSRSSSGCLSLVGCYDLWQKSHAVLRNYPVIGHIRYLIESIRPEIRQYLLETDSEKLPFSRSQRSLVYARAKNEIGDRPFGTLMDVYGAGFEFISHSIRPAPHLDPRELPHHDRWPAMHQALFILGAEYFRHELRLAERQRHRGAEPRREARRLCP